ncbi:hypothetical protein ETB97_009044 [Aspergillus alliaceus]|uniref:Uncharacterized protein n=1 Tax=Petromyces alliaceus TaxID=209559 RepID=A0A8H6AB37_PETAA|nr:hypothetical protein ETB97_009044 [Aspergillus burnettii]
MNSQQDPFETPQAYENDSIQGVYTGSTPEPGGMQHANRLVRELLDNGQASRQYQTHLESLVEDWKAALRQERLRCNQLTQAMEDLQWVRKQLESALRHTTEDNQWLQQELHVQKSRSQVLESRVAALSSLSDSLLQTLVESQARSSQDASVDTFALLLEVQKQQVQNSSPKPTRPRNSVTSVAASEAGNLMKPDEQNGDVTSNVPVNMQDSCPEVANGTDQSSEASNYECRGDEDYEVSFAVGHQQESSRLLPFLDAHKHLSGPEIEQAYFRYAGIYRKELALKAKERRIQHGWLHGARKTRRRRETNQLVMSQVPRHSYIPPQVAGAMSETERVYPDSLGRAVRSDKQGDRSQAAFTPGDTATCDTSMLSSMIFDQPTLEAQYLSG